MTFEYLGSDETEVTFANGDTCIMRSDEIDELVDFQNNKNKEVSLEEIQKKVKETIKAVIIETTIIDVELTLLLDNILLDNILITDENREMITQSIAKIQESVSDIDNCIEELNNVS